MKRLTLSLFFVSYLLFFPVCGGIIKTVSCAASLLGGVVVSQKAHEAYNKEKGRFEILNTNSSTMVKPMKEKALQLAEYLEDPETKWLSKPVEKGGNYLEDLERKYPQTAKYGFSALGLFCVAIWLIK